MGGIVMKTTDLMIGDWVYCYGKPTKITILTNADIIATEIGDGVITPIPLASEILEKNGWIQSRYETCKSVYEYKGLHLRHTMIKRSNGRWVANIDGIIEKFSDEYIHSFLRINVFYVHELQHALRLCRLDELTDNFKI